MTGAISTARRRRRWRTVAVSALGAAVTLGLTAGPVAAAELRIEGLTVTDTSVTFVLSPTNLTAGTTLDPQSVKVTMGGDSSTPTVTALGAPGSPSRTVVLVVDASTAVGTPATTLPALKSAVSSYIGKVAAGVSLGLVTYGGPAVTKVAPTTDHASVTTAVQAITANGAPTLFDGVTAGIAAAGATGLRSLVVVAAAADSGSTATAVSTTQALGSSGIGVEAVSFGADPAQVSALQGLATAGGGRVLTTGDAALLGQAMMQAAESLTNQVVVTAPIPSAQRGQVAPVEVTAKAGDATISAQSTVTLSATTTTPTPAPVPTELIAAPSETTRLTELGANSWVLPIAIAAVFVGLAGLLGLLAWRAVPEDAVAGRIRRRLARYTVAGPRPQETMPEDGALGSSAVARSAVDLAGRVVTNRDFDSVLAQRLDRAGVPLRPAEWLLIHVTFAIVVATAITFFFQFQLIPLIVGLAAGVGLPFAYLALKESRRVAEFQGQLAPTLQMLAGSLSAGYSLPQGMDTVVQESGGPMKAELGRALVESRLGVPLEDALDGVGARMKSKDFAWVVMAIRIQREVGGNLSEVLNNVAATIRERERLRRQVQVLSAEGRLSAYVLGGLPVVFTLYLILVRPEYIGVLFSSPIGIGMLIVGVLLLAVGAVWLRKVVTVDV